MGCPLCSFEEAGRSNSGSFSVKSPQAYLTNSSEFRIIEGRETAVEIDGDLYASNDIARVDPDQLRQAVSTVREGQKEFETIAQDCPVNTPLEYTDRAYLSRHLSTGSIQAIEELVSDGPLSRSLALLLAYVRSKNRVLGKSDETLDYYIRSRDEVVTKISTRETLDDDVKRGFFSCLLLASALLEELTVEILYTELFREEYRTRHNEERLRGNTPMGGYSYADRISILNKNEITRDETHSDLLEIKELRNDLVHDARKRATLGDVETLDDVTEWLHTVDDCIDALLVLSGKTCAERIARYGEEGYVKVKQSEAVSDAKKHWEREHPSKYQILDSSGYVEFAHLQWEVRGKRNGAHNITGGVSFENLCRDSEADAVFYDTLNVFVDACEYHLVRRIEQDLDESNLDRREFATLVLLKADNRYEIVGKRLATTKKYVQRKENVIEWRASTFEKKLFDTLPRPDKPVSPFDEG